MGPRLLHYSDVENAYDDPERIGRLAGLLSHRRDGDTLVVGTGDNTSPGVLSLVTEGRQALDFFRAVEPDLETFGNHDFDYGTERTRELIDRSPQTWLTANARHNGDRFGAGAGTEPWVVREVAGARVGFFGVTDPRTPSINPAATGLHFTDPIEAAREATAALREHGVEYVVALSHLGTSDEKLAVECDVDAILGGHVHTERIERIDGTLLTRPGVNGRVVVEVDLPDLSAERHAVASAPIDGEVAGRLRERMRAADLDEVVATVEEPIERTEVTAFRGESRIGNFVADAYRWATDADVGLQNSGGIRAGDPLAGEVTVADLISVVPFQEPVAVAAVSGAELLEMFRQAHGAAVGFGEPDWWHAHLSGATVVWDRTSREFDRVTVGGDPVDPDATYTVATTDYLFHTDHEFPALERRHRVSVEDVQYEVLVEYARTRGIDPTVEGRIVYR